MKNVSSVGHLSSVNLVTNAPHAVIDPPVGARLHQFWEKWEALGSSPKVVTTLREGYTLPFRFRPNLTRSPTVISSYHNPSKQSFLVEALHQLINNKRVRGAPKGGLRTQETRLATALIKFRNKERNVRLPT